MPSQLPDPVRTNPTPGDLIAISTLRPGLTPRTGGIDQDHVQHLARLETVLPPILVRRQDNRVIDGVHRLLAATLQGRQVIEVEWFDGSPEEAFLRAVAENAEHGLPLTTRDRRGAALRIMRSHPQLSDRAVARTTGLSSTTIADIRRRSVGEISQTAARVGRDGRLRPVNPEEGRRRAVQAIVASPQASLRELARISGVAPGTVRAVRLQMAQDEPQQPRPGAEAPGPALPAGERGAVRPAPAALVEKLLRDPALRQKEDGRQLLRMLQSAAGSAREDQMAALVEVVPPHCRDLVLDLARQFAERWHRFARDLDRLGPSGPEVESVRPRAWPADELSGPCRAEGGREPVQSSDRRNPGSTRPLS